MKGMDWLSERVLFGLAIIFGFFSLAVYAIHIVVANPKTDLQEALKLAEDALLVVGPLLGVIVNAIWKSDRADKQNAETVSTLATAVQTAMTLPPSSVPPPTPPATVVVESNAGQ